MPIAIPADQKGRQALVDRRHPSYKEALAHWVFCRATHDGGREWFSANMHRYFKEGEGEFKDRLSRAYRFNHTREVVSLVTKYIFKGEVLRNREEAPEALKRFWKRATRDGVSIDTFMRRVSTLASIYGRIWVGTDTLVPFEGAVTLADEKAGEARVYAYTVTPENVLDYSWAEDGSLNWVLFRTAHREDLDPVESSGTVRPRYVIWTRDAFCVLEERVQGRRKTIEIVSAGENAVGVVPLFPVDEQESDHPYEVPALIDDIAYLDRAIANYLSNLDAIIQDQTFSQLAIPAQGLVVGDDEHAQLLTMGTKRVFSYDGEAGKGPEYIAPDPKQAGVILAVVNKIIGEIYHSVGMAGERTKQDNAVGIDNSSGVAKAYDFERVNSLLASKADVLERAEDRLAGMVALWSDEKLPAAEDGIGSKDLVKYPDSYDVRGLYDEFEIAEKLMLVQAPDALRQEQMRALVAKLFPRLSQSLIESIEQGIKDWPPDPAELAADLAGATAEATAKFEQPAAGSQSRQGQVTSKTKTSPKGSKPKASK